MPLYLQSPDRFYLKAINVEIRFQCDENRRCQGLVFR